MKRPRLLLMLILVAIVAAMSLGIVRQFQGQSGLAEIRRRGELRVGLDASFPPFESLSEGGQVIGLDADLARAVAADLGVEAVFVNLNFDSLYEALKIGRVDVLISGLPVDPALNREVAYSVNYFNAGQALVAARPDIRTAADLAGQSVAVEWGSLGDMEARRLQQTVPGLRLDPQPDAAAALQRDIAIVDGVSARGQARLKIVTYLSDSWYAAAVAAGNEALLAEINRTLTRLFESGEMAQLEDKWF